MKKIISLLLALTMALALAACGGKTTPAASSGTPAVSTPGASAPASSTPAAPAEPIKLTIGINRNANVVDYENNALTKWLEEQTGYELEFVYYSSDGPEWRAQFAAMVAAKEKLPDIMYGHGWSAEERNAQGADGNLVDLMKYFGDKTFMSKNYSWYEKYVDDMFGAGFLARVLKEGQDAEGHLYGFPDIGYSESDKPQNMVYINQSWLDKLGLKMPTTYDEFVGVLRAFRTKDPNGNGKQDEIPAVGVAAFTSSDLPSWIINSFEFVNDSFLFNVTDGKVWLPYTTEKYREGLKALRDLVKEGLVSPLTWTIGDTSEMNALWTPADGTALCGVFCGHILLRTTTDNPVMYEYQPLAPFNYAPLKSTGADYYCYITTDCKNPEAAFNLLMQFSTEDGTLRARYGEFGKDWEWGKDTTLGREGVKVLNSNAYGGQTSSTWNVAYGKIAKYDVAHKFMSVITSDPGSMTWSEKRSTTNRAHGAAYLAVADKNNPAELIYELAYNQAEQDARGNIQTELLSFIKEARAQFASGERDPYSDADWNAYVKTFNDMGADKLLKAAQSAYERSKS